MRKLGAIVPFLIAVAVSFFTFAPIGGLLGEIAESLARSLAGSGAITRGDALPVLLALDLVALAVTFGLSYLGGVSLPSGLPHLTFALFFPLALAAAQTRFFELAGDVDGLADSFGGYNFVAVFVLVIALAQVGVSLRRRRHERLTLVDVP